MLKLNTMLFKITTFFAAMTFSMPAAAELDYFDPSSSFYEEKLEATYPLPQIEVGSNILLVGDSLALGLSHHFQRLANQSGYVPFTSGISGSTTSQWVKLIKRDLKKYQPKLVVVSLGTNDSALSEESLNQRIESYQELVKLIEESGSKVLWVTPPQLPTKKFGRREKVYDLLNQVSVEKFDSTQLQIERSGDQIHPTAKGYREWMDSIWWWLADNNYIFEGC